MLWEIVCRAKIPTPPSHVPRSENQLYTVKITLYVREVERICRHLRTNTNLYKSKISQEVMLSISS